MPVQIAAQPFELFNLAKFFGLDSFVMGGGVNLIRFGHICRLRTRGACACALLIIIGFAVYALSIDNVLRRVAIIFERVGIGNFALALLLLVIFFWAFLRVLLVIFGAFILSILALFGACQIIANVKI